MSIDFARARETMVEQQVRPWDVLDVRVLDTLAQVPREAYVAEALRALAYADTELPIGHGEHMLKPVLEGRALQALGVQAHESVLEIGTGSGYMAACLARLGREVVSIERHADLAEAARARLAAQGIGNVSVLATDAFQWTPGRTFDVICVTGAVASLPARFGEWPAAGGRMFVVHGRSPAMEAALVRRGVNGLEVDSLFETDLTYLAGAEPAPVFTL
ncbi:protein-L-isoaspartate O-methyltransferase [Thermomonas sp. S9]|uniref:protein-L-isoaspartate O-methyltransferase family protein n=1 Tax=Thermomonas sp. S9 TaxID=2885203 RepID=UPI00216AE56E|nr:protein-L-isoaspartate O-methyltransferase [Thermomonas sp. S9]MCR6495382.1 protein-L-isoaspartate O-methyltransferase [Thermomonas sp. S9]